MTITKEVLLAQAVALKHAWTVFKADMHMRATLRGEDVLDVSQGKLMALEDAVSSIVNADTRASSLTESGAVPVAQKMAPVQGWAPGIPWELHLEAYEAYCKKYSKQQALIEGGCRGGFGTGELDMFIPGWRDRATGIAALKSEVIELRAKVAATASEPAGGRDAVLEEAAKVAEPCRWGHTAAERIRALKSKPATHGDIDAAIGNYLDTKVFAATHGDGEIPKSAMDAAFNVALRDAHPAIPAVAQEGFKPFKSTVGLIASRPGIVSGLLRHDAKGLTDGNYVFTNGPHQTVEHAAQYIEHLEGLIAALPAPVPGGWMPIESAPKDGSAVLLFLGAPWNQAEKARWYAPWGNWQAGVMPHDPVREECSGIGSAVPTHWQPLPPAP